MHFRQKDYYKITTGMMMKKVALSQYKVKTGSLILVSLSL